jgi:hypothetical protein
MTAILLPPAEFQAIDADGHPYAGGTLETYVPGTTTPKATWHDPAGDDAHLNTNPILLDAAGRAVIYGDGAYRTVLRDSTGNLIWDQQSSTVISAAMLPVVSAPTIADAVALLGIQGMIDASVLVETNRAEAVENNLQAQINNEVARAEAAEAANATAISNEVTRAEAAEANLQTQINTINSGISGAQPVVTIRQGSATSDGSPFALVSITFVPAFSTRCISFNVIDSHGACSGRLYVDFSAGALTNTSAVGTLACDAGSGGSPLPATPFDWWAEGY